MNTYSILHYKNDLDLYKNILDQESELFEVLLIFYNLQVLQLHGLNYDVITSKFLFQDRNLRKILLSDILGIEQEGIKSIQIQT